MVFTFIRSRPRRDQPLNHSCSLPYAILRNCSDLGNLISTRPHPPQDMLTYPFNYSGRLLLHLHPNFLVATSPFFRNCSLLLHLSSSQSPSGPSDVFCPMLATDRMAQNSAPASAMLCVVTRSISLNWRIH